MKKPIPENAITQITELLAKCGYIASPQIAAQIALLLTQTAGGINAMLFDGPPGAGKTFLAKSIAKMLGVDYIYTQAHPGSCPEDFLYDANIVNILKGVSGDKDAVKHATDVIDFGFLPTIFQASQHGRVVAFIDEIDKSQPKTDSLFLAALQEGEVVVKGAGIIKANKENLLLFFTKNDERILSEPLMRRLRRDYLSFPTKSLELKIMSDAPKKAVVDPDALNIISHRYKYIPKPIAEVLIAFANLLRGNTQFIKPPATQELVMAAEDAMRLFEWGNIDLIGPICFGWLLAYRDDMKLAKDGSILTPQHVGDALYKALMSVQSTIEEMKLPPVDSDFASFGKNTKKAATKK